MRENDVDDNILMAIEEDSGSQPEIIYEGESGYVPPEVIKEPEVVTDEANEAEEFEEEETEEIHPKTRKPRVPAKTRINDLSRKYHTEARERVKVEEALTKLREENERLKRLSESQNKSVISSQESMIQTNILHAKQMKLKALEDGDNEAQVNADEALAAAYADKRRLEEFRLQQKFHDEDRQYQEERQKQQPQNQRQVEEVEEAEATPEAREWVSENQWFDENSDEYDPDLHQKAFSYAQYLDRHYSRNGREGLIGSYEYFDDLNRYMSRHIQPQPKKNFTQGGLVMNRPKAPVAGVNRGVSQPSGRRETVMMSRAEQDMARAHGWSDEKWFQEKKRAQQLEAQGRLITRNNGGV
jgi:hypothetical protein